MVNLIPLYQRNEDCMRLHVFIVMAFLLVDISYAVGAGPKPERPQYKREQVILNPDDFVASGEKSYLAFPAIVRLNDQEILISYKRGRSHGRDLDAILETVRFNTLTNKVVERKILGSQQGLIYQMGEWIKFPDGRLSNIVDVQKVVRDHGANRHHRVGSMWATSDDNGKSFSPMKKLGPIDGIEYGYIFEGVIVDNTVYVLAMDFPELTSRKSSYDEQGKRIYGQVSIIASSDNGRSWSRIRNLSREFGNLDLNESSLTPYKNGFIVATRGYDSKVRLHRVDKDFRLLKQRDLTADNEFIGTHIGRPRLFNHDRNLYLLGRNARGGPMELALFRIDPETFSVQRHVELGPNKGVTIKDGYYAVPYYQKKNGQTLFNVITYRMPKGKKYPEIVRLEFLWNEVR
ncbi:MAG: exo-alpha-sialidase [Planctomycetaceae bacterium]|nr:exo-alpha-sialidase [Planctomycetaceae bacterium]